MSVRARLACGIGLLGLCGAVAGQPPKPAAEPASLTLQEVTTAWSQLQQHGCLMAAYMTEAEDVAVRMPAPVVKARSPLPLAVRPDPGLRTVLTPSVRAYAISLPARTTDADLARLTKSLARLPNLRTIDLGGSKVGDAGVKNLKQIPQLQALFLDRTQVGDEGLQAIAECPHLTWLD